ELKTFHKETSKCRLPGGSTRAVALSLGGGVDATEAARIQSTRETQAVKGEPRGWLRWCALEVNLDVITGVESSKFSDLLLHKQPEIHPLFHCLTFQILSIIQSS
ncbi:unnamed protein product, partial [Rangifer tarandus platyrhynchus]